MTIPDRQNRIAQRASRTARLAVLVVVLIIVTAIGAAHQAGIAVVGADALCPFGGIETFWSLVTSASLIQRVAVSSVILLAITLLLALVFRRTFCGTICPLGTLQELAGKLGVLAWRGRRRPTLPTWLDRPARYLKYVVLAVFIVWSWQAASLVIRPYDPWVAWMHITSAELFTEFAIGAGILFASLIGSVVYERFFCKYLCPMGGFLALISRASFFKVRRIEETCTSCGACDRACPMNVTPSTALTVDDPECINCNECVNVCPVPDTLVISTAPALGSREVSPTIALLVTVIIVLMGVMLPTITGDFAWETRTLTKTVQEAGGAVDVNQIKGSMTFRDISKATGVPQSAIQERFGVTPSDMDEKIKDLAPLYGFDVHVDVRGFIAEYLGLTY